MATPPAGASRLMGQNFEPCIDLLKLPDSSCIFGSVANTCLILLIIFIDMYSGAYSR